MMKLNPQQLEAVRYLGGPLLVLAGAGSGKTGVITQKIKHLIVSSRYQSHEIAAITFTNKAAKEMRERISLMLSKGQAKRIIICTFHALGIKILREEANHIGYKKNFSILDAGDCAEIIDELLGGTGKEALFKAQQQISLWKNDLKTPEDVVQTASNAWEQQIARVYASYQKTLKSYQAVDFDDLIRLPSVLLQQNSEVRNKWQRRLRYLLVDECQDTNTCQFALMKLLTGAEGMFTAVGDDDQSIYAWRGANMENLRKMQENYPQMKVIKLEQNYRSTARILKIANKVIENNPKLFTKKLWSKLGEGEPVKVVACQNEQHEAEWVVSQIIKQKLIGSDKTQYADFAVLYRGKHQARIFEEALRSARIPYRLSGGQSFFDKAEIKDVLSYVRLLANPNDDPAFLRAVTTPKRGIGDVTLGKLNAYAYEHECSLYEAAQNEEALATLNNTNRQHLQTFMDMFGSYRAKAETAEAGELINSLLEEIGYENHLMQNEEGKAGEIKWRNVGELVSWFARKEEGDGKNIIELAQTVALMRLLERKDEEEADAVSLSTLHAAKGLEYPYVFLVGCEEGVLPHNDSIEEGNVEEERRLMYVGITRAKRQLTLTHCVKRKKQGTWQFPEPSRFIDEMPQEDIKILGRKGGEPIVSKEEGRRNLADIIGRLDNLKKSGAAD